MPITTPLPLTDLDSKLPSLLRSITIKAFPSLTNPLTLQIQLAKFRTKAITATLLALSHSRLIPHRLINPLRIIPLHASPDLLLLSPLAPSSTSPLMKLSSLTTSTPKMASPFASVTTHLPTRTSISLISQLLLVALHRPLHLADSRSSSSMASRPTTTKHSPSPTTTPNSLISRTA